MTLRDLLPAAPQPKTLAELFAAGAFDESKHPRVPGGEHGGEFTDLTDALRRARPPEAAPKVPAGLSGNAGFDYLTQGEMTAIIGYTALEGRALLDALRRGETPATFTVTAYGSTATARLADLDSAVGKARVERPGLVYRGIALRPGQKPLAEGEEFTDLGYVSTSTDVGKAADFAAYRAAGHAENFPDDPGWEPTGDGTQVFAIALEAGQPAQAGDMSVSEIILPRGQRYRVTGKGTADAGGGRSVLVTYLEVLR